MLKWLKKNGHWVFSGLGVAVLSIVLNFVWKNVEDTRKTQAPILPQAATIDRGGTAVREA